jgi:acyl-CoA reductase-like NAD-dependent aldehyde dehydrogenase
MPEPIGVLGLVCPSRLPARVRLAGLPPIAMGNTVVAVPVDLRPLLATDFYQVLDTSDVPPGVVNIVTGVQASWRRCWRRTTTWTGSGTSGRGGRRGGRAARPRAT